MIFDPNYYLLKLKRVAKTRIQITKHGKDLTLKDFLWGLATFAIFVLLLPLDARQAVPTNGVGDAPPATRPTLLADSAPPPAITARSAYLLDLKSGFVLYDKNSALKLPPASTTKLATALVVLDNYKLDELVEVPPNCILRTGESVMRLYPQEKITVRDLLRGMLIASAGDAACALARHHREGILAFVAEMNHLVAVLGLERTYFVNPTGLDSALQYSTARELTILARGALAKRFIWEAVKIKRLNVSSVDKKRWHHLKTTNELLGKMPGISGVKTGYTGRAKEVFVFYLKRGKKELLGTVMGSSNRFGDARLLLNWVLSSFFFPTGSQG